MGDPAPGHSTCHWALGEVRLGLGLSSSCVWMDKYSGSRRAHWHGI